MIKKIWLFYVDGFRSMTVGKTLWIIIIIKVVIMFAVLKIFFFPRTESMFSFKEENTSSMQVQGVQLEDKQ